MPDQTEGRAVREAYDGPEIDYDAFIAHHESQKAYEESSASKMGEARQERGGFLEDTGLSGKAVSAVRAGLKIKDEAKQQAWLRSMKALLPIAEDHITGNTTQDWVEAAEEDQGDADFESDAAKLDEPQDQNVVGFS